MILAGSFIWIELFVELRRAAGFELARLIDEAAPIALTGIVVSEVLQGLTRDSRQIEHYLSLWEILEPAGFSTYCAAAAIFRLGRSRGISLTTVDTLIAALALEHGASLFTLDRDFARISRLTSLVLYSPPLPS